MYVQVLDVSVFSVFKNHYDDVVEEYVDHNGPRTFQNIGYIWSDNSPFSLRTMPGSTFDLSSADSESSTNGDNDTEDCIDIVADKATEQQQHTQSLAIRSKQLTLFNMWKK
ncbi:unnamed protein product [Rotaria sp. Silwood2]|nr:unnamed protein product [Rotaria sp. Silwood2]